MADPHPDRSPLEEEYSRLTDPGKWRILGARAEAWLAAATDLGLATVERHPAVQWVTAPGTVITSIDRAVPHPAGAVPLVVAHSQLGNVDDAGIALGVGDPAVCVTWFPDCGCDACDTGSQDTLDDLDDHILSVMAGTFRRLSSGDCQITITGPGRWNASGMSGFRNIDAALTDPTGWTEIAGRPWLHHT